MKTDGACMGRERHVYKTEGKRTGGKHKRDEKMILQYIS
jgi:hypothetical protein